KGSVAERKLLERSLGAPERYGDLYARQHFIAEAARAGAPVAPMLPAPDEKALNRAIGHFGLPLVIKTDASCGGEGVIVARSEAEARAGWLKLRQPPARPAFPGQCHETPPAGGRVAALCARPSRHQHHPGLARPGTGRQSFRCRGLPVGRRTCDRAEPAR